MIEDIKQRLQNATLGKDRFVTEAQWGEFIAHSRTDMEYLLSQNKALVEALEYYANLHNHLYHDAVEGELYADWWKRQSHVAIKAIATYKGENTHD